MEDGPPPPPPPPHGDNPRDTSGTRQTRPGRGRRGDGLPDGNYDIFIVPPHSSGGGFIYFPSLQPQRNSFIAGSVCTLMAMGIWSLVFPVLKEWFLMIVASGGAGVALMLICVGGAAWAIGRANFGAGFDAPPTGKSSTTGRSDAGSGGGPGGDAGAGPKAKAYDRQEYENTRHGFSPGGREGAGSTPDPPPRGNDHNGSYYHNGGGFDGSQRQNPQSPPQPRSQPQPEQQQSQSQRASSPPPTSPPPEPNEEKKRQWEKQREEIRRRNEQKKREEEARRRLDEYRKRKQEEAEAKKRQQEQEELERQQQRDREQREREIRERRERLQREREEREQRSREERERQTRERLEAREKEAREKELREKIQLERELREKELREKEAKERTEKLEQERAQRAESWKAEKAAQAAMNEQAAKVAESTSSKKSSNFRKATAQTEIDPEEIHSFRPYDKPKPKKAPRTVYTSTSASSFAASSYADSESTSRTTPPPVARDGSYRSADPDAIVIKGAYAFNNINSIKPYAELIAGAGVVSVGLVLRITTEGMFIDDEGRGSPQREWDTKAWTLKVIETGSFRGLHLIRTNIRDIEGRKFVFVYTEQEKKAKDGLQRLRKSPNIRGLSVSMLEEKETKAVLERIGWA